MRVAYAPLTGRRDGASSLQVHLITCEQNRNLQAKGMKAKVCSARFSSPHMAISLSEVLEHVCAGAK